MSELITDEIFTDGQKNINAANMNGIISRARVQPDVIASKPVSPTMNIADTFLVLKTDNTLAQARFDTLVNSTSSTLPLADATKNGMLRQVSGAVTDYVGGDNQCHPISSIIPPGVIWDYAGATAPAGWLSCDGTSYPTATYPALFAIIGYVFGGSGANFSVPNFSGRFAAGTGGSIGALGTVGGAGSISLTLGNLPSHSHSITDKTHSHAITATDSGHTHSYNHPNAAGSTWPGGGGWTNGTDTTGVGYANISASASASGTGITSTNAAGSGTPFSILPPYVAVNKIIKV